MRALLPLLVAAIPAACVSTGVTSSGTAARVEANPLVLAEVADTAALLRALGAEPAVTSAADSVLVKIGYDSTGALTPVGVYGVLIPEAESARIAEVVAGQLAASGPPRSYESFVVVRGGHPGVLPFEYTRAHEPRLLNREVISSALSTVAAREGYRDRNATIWIFVSSRGEPERAEVRGSTGSIEMDRELVAVALRTRFSPARLDRFPIPVWVSLPVSLRGAPLQMLRDHQSPPPDPMVGRGRQGW